MNQQPRELRSTLPPLSQAGDVTTLYSYEGGPARNALLAAMALQLAGDPDRSPVLMIDWDLEAPSLHCHFDADALEPQEEGGPPGLLEYVEALRVALGAAAGMDADSCVEALADRVLDAVDWRAYVERADGRRPLYLMRAGVLDDDHAGRAARFDWHALFEACPALFRRLAARLAAHFRHVLVASRAGRSAAVSVCTTLVPDRIVGLFTPASGSLEGLEGVVRRAIEYRGTHEEEHRPLLLYPVPCSADGARSDPGQRWRRGDGAGGMPAYQPRLEALLRASYGSERLRLDGWFDEIQLPLSEAVAIGMQAAPAHSERRALARLASCLLSWLAHGFFPWQSLPELRLRLAIARSREEDATAALANSLARLGALCRQEGRTGEADALLRESLALRRAALGEDHAESRAGLRALAALHHADGRLDEARRGYELLAQGCERGAGAEHPETLAARSCLACVLGELGEDERALALHDAVVAACERRWGASHLATLDSLEDLAVTLGRQRESERARILYERVLDGRRRLQGSEHDATLRCGQRLAQLLGAIDDLGNARRLLEAVLRARERHDGPDAAVTLAVREALAEILAAQGDLAAVRRTQEWLVSARERHLGASHPDTLSIQEALALTLNRQGDAEAARRLSGRVAELRHRLEETDG